MEFSQKNYIESKIFSTTDAFSQTLHRWRFKEEKIVFTNGCFDVLHKGHVELLCAARDFGTKLIVGLNADSSVKKLKGENRPINSEQARAFLLASLICVDAVILFEEETPKNCIEFIEPNVLVKGGDYTVETIVGASSVLASGGEVRIIPLVENYSTTSIAQRITEL